jgi:hypothetical protein
VGPQAVGVCGDVGGGVRGVVTGGGFVGGVVVTGLVVRVVGLVDTAVVDGARPPVGPVTADGTVVRDDTFDTDGR